MTPQTLRLYELLIELSDYMEDRADTIDGAGACDAPSPNAEMSFSRRLETEIWKLNHDNPPIASLNDEHDLQERQDEEADRADRP